MRRIKIFRWETEEEINDFLSKIEPKSIKPCGMIYRWDVPDEILIPILVTWDDETEEDGNDK